MTKNKQCLVAVLVAFCICITAVLPIFSVGAVSYAGSGTLSDPYLVETAEQLQGMRENLTAHYKLNNTIDLSGMDFKPIGRLDNAFRGSFVSDLNSDGTPKFAIKNLKVKVADTPYAAEKKNKWEAALFGYAEGATFSGIYVFDAYIRCEVLGDNEGAVIYGTYKPGMNEMNSAILIGEAQGCTIMNCGTTGKIDSRASNCGGLVGRLQNSTVTNCYSTADVITEGKWGVGGFAGAVSGSNISYCFATGYAESVQGSAGAFVENTDAATVISNCYATGDAKSYTVDHHGSRPGAAFLPVQTDESIECSISNCFSLGNASDEEKYDWKPISNCYSLKGTKGNSNFTYKDAAGIKAAFKGIDGWDTSGEYPTITTIGFVKDTNAYQPGFMVGGTPEQPGGDTDNTPSQNQSSSSNTDAQSSSTQTSSQPNNSGSVSSGSQTSSVTSTNSQTSASSSSQANSSQTTSSVTSNIGSTVITTPIDGTSSSTTSSEQTPAASVSEVVALIEALPNPEEDSIAIENKAAVVEAWKSYDSLGSIEKEDFDPVLFAKLSQLRIKISMIVVSDMITMIKELPEDTKDYSDEDVENILVMWEDYNFLDDSVKNEIAQKHVDKLSAAYEYASKNQSESATNTVSSKLTTFEIVIVIVSVCIILFAVAFYVFAGIVFLKKSKVGSSVDEAEILEEEE